LKKNTKDGMLRKLKNLPQKARLAAGEIFRVAGCPL